MSRLDHHHGPRPDHATLTTDWRTRLDNLDDATIEPSIHTAIAHIWPDWNIVADGGTRYARVFILHNEPGWLHFSVNAVFINAAGGEELFWEQGNPTARRDAFNQAITTSTLVTNPADLATALLAVPAHRFAAEAADTLLNLNSPDAAAEHLLIALNPDTRLAKAITGYRAALAQGRLPMRIHYTPGRDTPVPTSALVNLDDPFSRHAR